MPRKFYPNAPKCTAPSFDQLLKPTENALATAHPLMAKGNRPLQMNFEQQLRALVYFHLEEHTSGRHLIQALEEDDFARHHIAPPDGIQKSSFFEAINSRGLEQLEHVYQHLQNQASNLLPAQHTELGELVGIDGSLIQAVLSMYWADYRDGSKKAKVHVGFDINRGIPSKIFLTDGKEGERPFVGMILSPGHTGVMDRGYQCHKSFDQWQIEGKHFVCRIKANTKKTCIQINPIPIDSIVFYDAIVLLGTANVNQTQKEVRVVGYRIDDIDYWVATDRRDLAAEQVAFVYKLRWQIEKFLAWWKRHLKVYHLIARTEYGLMVQILSGLITYLLLAIYCHEHYQEKVSIKRVRELRIKIQNELRDSEHKYSMASDSTEQRSDVLYAKT
ncbi:MAG: IS4 family transposase [Syntrophobacteria bacterium]